MRYLSKVFWNANVLNILYNRIPGREACFSKCTVMQRDFLDFPKPLARRLQRALKAPKGAQIREELI
jgi:hypothetical protein